MDKEFEKDDLLKDETDDLLTDDLLIEEEPHETVYAETVYEETKEPEVVYEEAKEPEVVYEYGNGYAGEKPKTKRKMGAILAAVAVIGVFVGGPVGIGIGVGTGIAKNYLGGSVANSETAPTATEKFSFDNAEIVYAPTHPADAKPVNSSDEKPLTTTLLPDVSYSFAPIIQQVEPSVVSIISVSAGNAGTEFFGFSQGTSTSAGSGIVFHEDSEKYYIVTNYHVVEKAQSVKVSFAGKGEFNAKLIGKKDTADVAVISILKEDVSKEDIKVSIAKFGDSDALQVGDVVLAIGNALGEGNSATNGIISAKDKEVTIDQVTYNALQTNAAINAGNSGGPLVNLNGEVIGINSAKISTRTASSSGIVEGMGYSIPSNDVKALIEELMGPKKPVLGIIGGDMTEAYAQHYGLPTAGVVVNEALAGYPAEKGGILAKDIITAFNGHTIFSFEDLRDAVKQCEDGQTVSVNIIRGEENQLITLTITMFIVPEEDF